MSATIQDKACRCMPSDPCWYRIPWNQLNASVGGRLEQTTKGMMEPCVRNVTSQECNETLQKAMTDDQWVSDSAYNMQHSGFLGAWNISTEHSAYTVRARNEYDFSHTVKFAHMHNLRLVVKGTGHDWYGRSAAAGSLLLWTHLRKNMTWDDSFSVPGCDGQPGIPAVTVQSGVQFADLYPEAMRRGKLVIGGTCDTVGVGGCWLSGCYGGLAKLYGNGAMNILAARVVLANGSLVTTSKCAHPDLFWSLRGGGGGVAAVVVDFVARTHPAPTQQHKLSFSASAATAADFRELLEHGLRAVAAIAVAADSASDGGFGFGTNGSGAALTNYHMSISIAGFRTTEARQRALVQPLVDLVRRRTGLGLACAGEGGACVATSQWNISEYDPHAPWHGAVYGGAPGSGFGGQDLVVAMHSRYVPLRLINTSAGQRAVAAAYAEVAAKLPVGSGMGIMLPKALAGMSAALRDEFRDTALNPVLLDTAGTMLLDMWVPWFTQLEL